MKRLVALFFLTSLLVGCDDGKPKLDTSSNEAFKSSLNQMEKGFSDEDKMKLAIAMTIVQEKGGVGDDWRSNLNGKTAPEIFNMARSLQNK